MATQDTLEKRRIEANYQQAVKNFETAARYFQKQQYDKAKEIYEKLVELPIAEIADRARVHLQLCERKLGASTPGPKSAEDYYNLGVAELNVRNLDGAIEHLNKADKLAPDKEHIRYTLAAAYALQGNADVALEHLKSSIALRRENRVLARHDEDLASLASDPRFKRIVSGESGHN